MCVDSWSLLTQRLLSLPSDSFLIAAKSQSAVQFVMSYSRNASSGHDAVSNDIRSASLRRQCFLLTHRLVTQTRPVPYELLEYTFFADLSTLYGKSHALNGLLADAWSENHLDESSSMLKSKAKLTLLLEKSDFDLQFSEQISKAAALAKACFPFAQFLMVGSDFIDALSTASNRQTNVTILKKLTVLAYLCLTSLMRSERPQTSSLVDHLYSLDSTVIPKALVESTPFLRKFEGHLATSNSYAKRARPLLDQYISYKSNAPGKRKRPIRRKIDKGKGKAQNKDAKGMPSIVHVHKMSLISQVQDLFPDLGSGFVVKLLDTYEDDFEQVTAHLLDESLPANLQHADRTETLPQVSPSFNSGNYELAQSLAPHSTPPLPPSRHNIYDNDDFDRLAIDTSKLRLGHKNVDLTADKLLATEKPPTHKAAILAALAAFDSDDDERDDTYDAADVGGTVDTTFADSDAETKQDKAEDALFTTFKTNTDVFKRDAETRRSKQRAALKVETGMTDEAIEGWAIMMTRDPKRLQRLERLHELGGRNVQQRALAGSSWRADSGAEETEDSDVGGQGRGGDRGRGRGRGGGRGRAASAAGPQGDRATQAARQRKDANKGSRATHNRRDQRARKMARGGGMVG